jgi:hypothetical protein
VLESLSALVEGRVRLWRSDGRTLRPAGGRDPAWSLAIPASPGVTSTPAGPAWLEPVPGSQGLWVEVGGENERAAQ